MMMKIPNLLLVSGTGTKAGKTSAICRIIRQCNKINITAIKITPHFHETTPGLITIEEDKGYAIYEETNPEGTKDTSRMLDAGASKVYFAKVWDDQLLHVFEKIMEKTDPRMPVICESPALRDFIDPGIFIIMTSELTNKPKDISNLKNLSHLMLKLEDLSSMKKIPVRFENGTWISE
jgi:hypothetical protein